MRQKRAYELRFSVWSSDVCSSDLSDPVRSSRFTSASKWGHMWGHIPNFEGPHFQMPPNMPQDDHESIDGCGRAQCATEDSALQALDRRRPLSGGDAERRQVLAEIGRAHV